MASMNGLINAGMTISANTAAATKGIAGVASAITGMNKAAKNAGDGREMGMMEKQARLLQKAVSGIRFSNVLQGFSLLQAKRIGGAITKLVTSTGEATTGWEANMIAINYEARKAGATFAATGKQTQELATAMYNMPNIPDLAAGFNTWSTSLKGMPDLGITFEQGAKFMSVMGGTSEQLAQSIKLLGDHFGVTGKGMKSFLGGIEYIGEQGGVADVAMKEFNNILGDIAAKNSSLQLNLTAEQMRNIAQETIAVAGAYKKMGISSDEAMGAAKELTNSIFDEGGAFTKMIHGLGQTDVGNVFKEMAIGEGSATEAMKVLNQQSPLAMMKELVKLQGESAKKNGGGIAGMNAANIQVERLKMTLGPASKSMATFIGLLENDPKKARLAVEAMDGTLHTARSESQKMGDQFDKVMKKYFNGLTHADDLARAEGKFIAGLRQDLKVLSDAKYLEMVTAGYHKLAASITEWSAATGSNLAASGLSWHRELTETLMELQEHGLTTLLPQRIQAAAVAFGSLIRTLAPIGAAIFGLGYVVGGFMGGAVAIGITALIGFLTHVSKIMDALDAKEIAEKGKIVTGTWEQFKKALALGWGDVVDKIKGTGLAIRSAVSSMIGYIHQGVDDAKSWLLQVDWGGYFREAIEGTETFIYTLIFGGDESGTIADVAREIRHILGAAWDIVVRVASDAAGAWWKTIIDEWASDDSFWAKVEKIGVDIGVVLVGAAVAASAALAVLAVILDNVLVAAFVAVAGAVWSFTIALLANPITWAVLAVAALGVALYKCYEYWQTLSDGVKIFIGVVALLMGGPFMLLPILLIAEWDKFKAFFLGTLSIIGSAFKIAWNVIKILFFTTIIGIKLVWGELVDYFDAGVDAIKKLFSGPSIFDPFLNYLKSITLPAWMQDIVDWMSNLPAMAKKAATATAALADDFENEAGYGQEPGIELSNNVGRGAVAAVSPYETSGPYQDVSHVVKTKKTKVDKSVSATLHPGDAEAAAAEEAAANADEAETTAAAHHQALKDALHYPKWYQDYKQDFAYLISLTEKFSGSSGGLGRPGGAARSAATGGNK